MKIAMVASECNPFVKTGGLADVIYSLSRELAKQGHEVFVFLPYYKKLKDKQLNTKYLRFDFVNLSWRHQYIGTSTLDQDGIHFIFIENDQYFYRDNIYGYDDDGERFAYFVMAVQKVMNELKIYPDIVHLHDWQSAMLAVLLKFAPLNDKRVKTVLTIHNPAFKGYLNREALGDLFNLDTWFYDGGSVRLDGMVSTLKAGINFADKITTVSPTHRNELLSDELSQGLAPVLHYRQDDFCGIVNGIDDVEFNPETDPKIVQNYSAKAYKKGKKACKSAIISRFGLTNKEAPTFGLVSRLTWQKGIKLILENLDYLMSRGANVILLGNGEYELEQALESYRNRYPNQIGIYIGYNDELAHQIYAGCDFFLMPSLFEPCGIGQIIAQRYGTLPIVRETGGLVDTVHAEVDGFSFSEFSGFSMRCVLDRALNLYYCDKEFIDKLRANALSLDRSWKDSSKMYLGIYKELIRK